MDEIRYKATVMVHAQRDKQVKKGFDAKHDDGHTEGEIAGAGLYYTYGAIGLINGNSHEEINRAVPRRVLYPWGDPCAPPPFDGDALENLAKGAACILAEMERILRAQELENHRTYLPTTEVSSDES